MPLLKLVKPYSKHDHLQILYSDITRQDASGRTAVHRQVRIVTEGIFVNDFLLLLRFFWQARALKTAWR
jgi:hypothetical protein